MCSLDINNCQRSIRVMKSALAWRVVDICRLSYQFSGILMRVKRGDGVRGAGDRAGG